MTTAIEDNDYPCFVRYVKETTVVQNVVCKFICCIFENDEQPSDLHTFNAKLYFLGLKKPSGKEIIENDIYDFCNTVYSNQTVLK